MPPVSLEESSMATGAPPPKAVGIIYPPPEVRNIVDKTAAFVARNGLEFEQRIKQNEVNNPKFNFLSPGDPYHTYYQHRVTEIKDGKDEPKQKPTPAPAATSGTGVSIADRQASSATEAMKQRQSELLKQAQKEQEPPPPTEPPLEFEFISDPPSISAFDLDVVKLTAMFVARNGRQFLTNLMQKEQRNYQFDFLRPQHSLFQYFTKLLEQYTKVLIPPKDLIGKLKRDSEDEKLVLDQIDYRVRWVKAQEAKKRREEEAAERERVSYAQVDWHNFVVVETVDYQPWETGNFPPPTNPVEVGARVLMQRRVEQMPSSVKGKEDEGVAGESNTNVEDMEEGSSSEEDSDEEDDDEDSEKEPSAAKSMLAGVDAAPAVNQPAPPSLPTPGNVEVRQYDPKQAKGAKKPVDPASEEYLVSPITGERVPASKVQEHMRIGLLDPRWVEERDKQITSRASEEVVFAPGRSIESSLKQLAERRTDIFGVGEEAAQEAAIGKKMGEEERRAGQILEDGTVVDAPPKVVTWDGHSSSAESVTAKARANVSLDEQLQQMNREKGLMAEKEKIGPRVTNGPSSTVSAPPQPLPPTQVTMPPMAPPPVQLPPQPQPPMLVGAPPPPMPPAMPGLPSAPAQPFFVAAAPGFPPMAPPQGPPMMEIPTPQPPSVVAPVQAAPPPPVVPAMQMPPSDEPPAKRPRGEEHLLPESDFMTHYGHAGPVTFHVVCPQAASTAPGASSEWRLNGQTVALTLALTDTVSVIKARLHKETGMAPGKQKLQLMESIFLKDANTLAYYNIRPGTIITLQVKERGGRKK